MKILSIFTLTVAKQYGLCIDNAFYHVFLELEKMHPTTEFSHIDSCANILAGFMEKSTGENRYNI